MRTIVRLGTLALFPGLLLGARWLRSIEAVEPIAVGPDVLVAAATPEQLQLVRWVLGRFEAAGLEAPAVEIEFHGDPGGCGGHLGYARGGRVDLCTSLVNAMTRRVILHEVAHIWLDQHLAGSIRERFIELRGLRAWNDSTDVWRLRGYEQAAEILGWGLGERILTPTIPDDGPRSLAEGFELLTGVALPRPTNR